LHRILPASSSQECAPATTLDASTTASTAAWSASSSTAGSKATRTTLSKSTTTELTKSAAAPLSIECFGTLRSCRIELSATERLESIAQLTTIEARRVTSDCHDVRLGIGRESRRQQTRRRIRFVDRRA
jgi:hypothetical protein